MLLAEGLHGLTAARTHALAVGQGVLAPLAAKLGWKTAPAVGFPRCRLLLVVARLGCDLFRLLGGQFGVGLGEKLGTKQLDLGRIQLLRTAREQATQQPLSLAVQNANGGFESGLLAWRRSSSACITARWTTNPSACC